MSIHDDFVDPGDDVKVLNRSEDVSESSRRQRSYFLTDDRFPRQHAKLRCSNDISKEGVWLKNVKESMLAWYPAIEAPRTLPLISRLDLDL